MIKNRTHALLSRYGITVEASDIFGRGGIREIEKGSEKLCESDRYILSDMLLRVSNLKDRGSITEDQISRKCENNKDVSLLMTIPGIDYYLASLLSSFTGDVNRFPDESKLASFFGIVPANRDSSSIKRRGHMSKDGAGTARWALSMAVDTVKIRNKAIGQYYERQKNRIREARSRSHHEETCENDVFHAQK